MTKSAEYNYQIGGSLNVNAPSYVIRQADSQLYTALFRGEFCYVFNCRQMGKSSIRVQVKNRLEQAGFVCVSLDMTNIGSQDISVEQWYKSIASELWRGLNLIGKVKFKAWWEENAGVSPVKKLSNFILDVVLSEVEAEKIFILIDEIDSVFSLNFAADDFFALMRYFYNARADNQELNRLCVALFGVATPSELIKDSSRTPFNIGTAIELGGLEYPAVMTLADGLTEQVSRPEILVQEILKWTEGQPFLTQKICNLARELLCQSDSAIRIFPGSEAAWIKNLVRTRIIENWQGQDEPEHIKTISDRLLRTEQSAGRLLALYAQVLNHGAVAMDGSIEQNQLLLSGVVKKSGRQLVVRNPIYQQIFDLVWVNQKLASLRPYSSNLDAWVESNYLDPSRLLRGEALQKAQDWAADKSLSDLDYRYLAASQKAEQQAARKELEASKLVETEAKLAEQKQNAKLQKLLAISFGGAFLVSAIIGVVAYKQSLRAIASQKQAAWSEIESRATSAKALFASHQKLDALVEAIKAKQKLQQMPPGESQVADLVDVSLLQAVQGSVEYNRLSGHKGEVSQVTFSPDGQTMATASADNTVKLWSKQGKELSTLTGHTAVVRSVAFNPQGNMLATASADNTVKLWNLQGKELLTLRGHTAAVRKVIFSPDGKLLATASADKTVKIWNKQGQELRSFLGHIAVKDIAFSPDGKTIAAAEEDQEIHLWDTASGELLNVLLTHTSEVLAVAFSPDGKLLASGSADHTIRLWNTQGEELNTLRGHTASVQSLAFSPDGKLLASGSADNTIRLWSTQGQELKTLRGHIAAVQSLAFSPNGLSKQKEQIIASASADNTVKLWKTETLGLDKLSNHTAGVRNIVFSPDGQTIATSSADNTIKLWSKDGQELATLEGHSAAVFGVALSPDGQTIATASADNTIKLWSKDGQELKTIKGHSAAVRDVNFSPDGQTIVTASADKTVKLWNLKGQELKTIKGHQAGLWEAVFSPNGKAIATASEDKTIKLWDVVNDRIISSMRGHNSAVLGVAFSPDGQSVVSGSRDNTVKLWDLYGQEKRTFRGHKTLVESVAFSPDGKSIASGSGDQTIKLWNLQGEELTTFKGHNAAVKDIAFNPNGKSIASASEDSTAILWNLEELLNLKPLPYACNWVKDYLKHNAELTLRERNLCN